MPVEYGDRFNMRSVREHVDDTRRRQRVAFAVDQHRRVARERCRIAGYIDDPQRTASGQGLDQLDRAVTRRVDQHAVEMAEAREALAIELEQIGLHELG